MAFVVSILGAGKVGTALARALRQAGACVQLRARRSGPPRTPIDADLLILAVRDGELPALCAELAAGRVSRRTPVVHCSGMLGAEALDALRDVVGGTAQMHPMISFASRRFGPPLSGGHLLVDGSPVAVKAARKLARLLVMTARTMPGLDRAAYHAAAGLVANGTAALAAAGVAMLVAAGIDPRVASKMLGPLLLSVAANVTELGLPDALTGPVRRGDANTLARHRAILETHLPAIVPLFHALVRAQLPMASQLGEADPSALERIAALALGDRPVPSMPSGRRSRFARSGKS